MTDGHDGGIVLGAGFYPAPKTQERFLQNQDGCCGSYAASVSVSFPAMVSAAFAPDLW